MATRAVHLELIHSLDSKFFLLALQRFINRRRKLCKIVFENASKFVGASRMLKEEFEPLPYTILHSFHVGLQNAAEQAR